MASRRESPIFVKSHEMMVWLLAHTRKFPKGQRFVMAQRMEQAALDLHDGLLLAVKRGPGRPALEALARADFHLERLKTYNRLATDLRLHSAGQCGHLAEMLDEVGRLLGGWMKSSRGSGPAPGGIERARG